MKKSLLVVLLTAVFGIQVSCNRPVEPPVPGAWQIDRYRDLIAGKPVAVVANQTSMVGTTHLVDTLKSSGFDIRAIFVPEHGFRDLADAGDHIEDGKDVSTGITIISLYGGHFKPLPEDIEGISVVLFDIQDVGVRFYTYISTLHYVMEACAEKNVECIILDRPNPNGGYFDGPILEDEFRSFVGMHPIPVVYGMTLGELATMINGEGWLAGGIKCDLKVIPCVNYSHDSLYHLPVNPSPNLNSMEAIYLYPSLCFFEGTVMSLGRGTDFPFRVYGHPDYPDTTFSFIPKPNTANKAPLFANQTCYGTDLRKLTTEQLAQMKEINLEWLIDAYHAMESNENFFIPYFDQLAGTSNLRKEILADKTATEIRQAWQADLERFRRLRRKYLLYDDFR